MKISTCLLLTAASSVSISQFFLPKEIISFWIVALISGFLSLFSFHYDIPALECIFQWYSSFRVYFSSGLTVSALGLALVRCIVFLIKHLVSNNLSLIIWSSSSKNLLYWLQRAFHVRIIPFPYIKLIIALSKKTPKSFLLQKSLIFDFFYITLK